MTPTQLRAFSAVVRLGSVKEAAAELKVTEAAVSLNVGQLRRELDDRLFTRTSSGLAFTPGGLRLARRAVELLGLQDRTVREVSQARAGRRTLRVAASDLFAEYAAPGLIELFTARARDLDVELSVSRAAQFADLLLSRGADVTIGPRPDGLPDSVRHTPFLNYQVVVVVAPQHPLAAAGPSAAQLRDQQWLLGPSAASGDGAQARLLRGLGVPEARQRIYQSNAAAIEEARRGQGVTPAVSFVVRGDLSAGRLVRVGGPAPTADGAWGATTLAGQAALPAAAEFVRFVGTPRAMQAMLRGSGVGVGHFRPSVHVTLWN